MKIVDYDYIKKDVFQEHNRIRSDPKSYIPILKKYIRYFNGKLFEKPNSDIGIQTKEGPEAFLEAIEFLGIQKPVCRLKLDNEISKASQEHCEFIGYKGICDHIGLYNSNYASRVSKYVEWESKVAENIDYGAESGEEIIISFLVDDGVEERCHRDLLFDKDIHYIGIYSGHHKKYQVCTVVNYVVNILSYKNKKEKILNDVANTNTKNLGARSINNLLIISQTKKLAQMNNNEIPNDPFKNDPDAPKNSFSCLTNTTTNNVGNKKYITIKKTYTLEDGTEEVITTKETKRK